MFAVLGKLYAHKEEGDRMSEQLYTIRQIAEQLGKPHWRVRYVCYNRDAITPSVLVGSMQLFNATLSTARRSALKLSLMAYRGAV